MFNRGLNLPAEAREYLHKKLAQKAPPKPKEEKKTVARSSYNFGWMEEILDEFYTNGYKVFEPGIYKKLVERKDKIQDAKIALDYYTEVLNDVRDNRKDYVSSGAKAYRSHVSFLEKIVDELQTFVSATRKKVVRKKRTAKAKPASKIVANVKFQLRENDLKLVSQPPESLVGATEVFLYNTKYRTLQHFVADGPMNVKGTSLKDFNPDKSTRKTLRKPSEFFDLNRNATMPAIRKAYKAIKTKPAAVNGRLNEHTIILKVK